MSDPLTQEQLNAIIGGGDKKPLTVDDILTQAKTGELPKTVAKKRVKQSVKFTQGKDLTDEEAEPITQEYLNSIINPEGKTLGTLNYEENMLPPQQGMGDLKVADQNIPNDIPQSEWMQEVQQISDAQNPPREISIPETTGETRLLQHPSMFDSPEPKKSLGERLTEAGTQITDKGKRVAEIHKLAQEDLMKGDFISYLNKQLLLGIESANYLGGVTGFPTGTLPLELMREVAPQTTGVLDKTFEGISEIGKYGMKLSPIYNLVDDETKVALDELGALISQFAIPLAGVKLIKGRIESVPVEQVKDVVKGIKDNIDQFREYQEPAKIIGEQPKVDAPELIVDRPKPTAVDLIDQYNTLHEQTKFVKDPDIDAIKEVLVEQLNETGVKYDADATGKLFQTEPTIIAEPNKTPSQVLIKNDVATYEPSTIQTNISPKGSQRIFEPKEFGTDNAVPFDAVFLDKKFVDSKPIGDAVNILEYTKMERDGILRVVDDVTTTLWDLYRQGKREVGGMIKDRRQRRVVEELEKRGVIKQTDKKGVYEITEPPSVPVEPIYTGIEQPPYPIEKTSIKSSTESPFKPLENAEPTVKPSSKIEQPLNASNEEFISRGWRETTPKRWTHPDYPDITIRDNGNGRYTHIYKGHEIVEGSTPAIINHLDRIDNSLNPKSLEGYPIEKPSNEAVLPESNRPVGVEVPKVDKRGGLNDTIKIGDETYKIVPKKFDSGYYFDIINIDGYEVGRLEAFKDVNYSSPKLNTNKAEIGFIRITEALRNKGLATALYNYSKTFLDRLGIELQHSENLSADGRIFKAGKRLITDEMVAEANRIINTSPDKIASNPADWYAKMSKAYLIKGARFIEDGVIAFKDWSKKMIQEFGTEIVPYLKNLYEEAKNFKQTNEKVKEPEIINETPKSVIDAEAQKKFGSLKDRLTDPNWTPEQVALAKTLADDVLNEKINLSNPLGKQSRKVVEAITKGVFDTYHNMVKYYGANGSEILNKLHEGNKTVMMVYKLAYPYLEQVRELVKKIPRDDRQIINQKVVKALENRANADAILGNDPIARQYYDNAQGFYDTFKGFLQERGIPVVEDYFTRIAQSDLLTALEEVINANGNEINGTSWFALNDGIAVDTPFVKQRTGELKAKVENPIMVMERYFNSMTKYVAYKNALDYYYTDFTKTMPRLLKKNNLRYVNRLIKDNISPEYLSSSALKNMRDNVYITALWNNPKATIFNRFQRWFTDFFVPDDVAKMTTQNYLKVLPDNVEKLLNSLEFELPEYMEIGKAGKMNAYRKAMESGNWFKESTPKWLRNTLKDRFRITEQNNWKYSQVAGIIEAVKRFDPNIKTFEEVNKALDNPQVFQSAYRNAMMLSNRVQFGVAPFIRPALFKNPYTRLFAMFTRFKFGQWQVLLDTLRSQEGTRGLRAQNILRRGISEDVMPVELLREVETMRVGLEKIKSEYKNPETVQFANEFINYLKTQEKDLNRIIKEIEPLRPKKEIVAKWAEYYGILSGISFAWQMLSNMINYYTDESADKPEVYQMLIKTAYDLSPAPMYGTNLQGVFKNPLLPNTELMLYGNLNWKGLGKESLRYLFRTTPLGIPDRLAFNIPQKKISKYLFGKDEITNPRPIRQIQAEIDKEQEKENPDPLKLTQLNNELQRLKYNSDVSDEYKQGEFERYKKKRETEKKTDSLDFTTPEMDSLKFEQNYLLKQLQNQ